MVGSLIIFKNEALNSLKWLQNLTSVVSDLTICENLILEMLDDLQNVSRQVNGSVTIVGNGHLEDLKALDYLTNVNGHMTIKSGSKCISVKCKNLIQVGDNLVLTGVIFNEIKTFGSLKTVRHDLFISEYSLSTVFHTMPSLYYVGSHITLMKIDASGDCHFSNLTSIGGDLVMQRNEFGEERTIYDCIVFQILPYLEVVGGRLDINFNELAECRNSSHILPNLKSLWNSSANGTCGLTISNNTGYRFIRGLEKLDIFNGFLTVIGNKGLYGVAGFVKITSPNFTAVSAQEQALSNGALGALVIAVNPDLKSIYGFQSLTMVVGDLLIFKNRQMDRLVLENLMHVSGLTQIFENGIAFKNGISTDPLPYSEPDCRTRINSMPFFDFSNGTTFITRLERNECFVQKLVPTMVGVMTIATILIVSYILFHCIFLDQSSRLANDQHMTTRDLGNMFGVHCHRVHCVARARS